MSRDNIHILLLEDNVVDAEAISRALRQAEISTPIRIARDGVEGLQILRGEGVAAMPRPFIILLDLNMPRMNGLEFLAELRADDKLASSVVYVVTSSSDERDRAAVEEHGVSGYIVKSRAKDGIEQVLEILERTATVRQHPVESP